MTTPEERLEKFISQAVYESESNSHIEIEAIKREAKHTWLWVLNYFDTNEPALADAIRYGLVLPSHSPGQQDWRINYPKA